MNNTGRPWTEPQIQQFIALYNEGLSYRVLSIAMQRTEAAIDGCVQKLAKQGRLERRRAHRMTPVRSALGGRAIPKSLSEKAIAALYRGQRYDDCRHYRRAAA